MGDSREVHVVFLVDEGAAAEEAAGALPIEILIESFDLVESLLEMEHAHLFVQDRRHADGVDFAINP